jgi:hypothetical protein
MRDPNPIAVIRCHMPRAFSATEEARISCAVDLDLALPLQFFLDIGVVRRSTVFRDRLRGLVKLRVVNGHASLTPRDLAAYLMELQRLAA